MKKLFGTWVLLFWLPIALIALAHKEWMTAISRVWKEQ
jgi:hypothetical protein